MSRYFYELGQAIARQHQSVRTLIIDAMQQEERLSLAYYQIVKTRLIDLGLHEEIAEETNDKIQAFLFCLRLSIQLAKPNLKRIEGYREFEKDLQLHLHLAFFDKTPAERLEEILSLSSNPSFMSFLFKHRKTGLARIFLVSILDKESDLFENLKNSKLGEHFILDPEFVLTIAGAQHAKSVYQLFRLFSERAAQGTLASTAEEEEHEEKKLIGLLQDIFPAKALRHPDSMPVIPRPAAPVEEKKTQSARTTPIPH